MPDTTNDIDDLLGFLALAQDARYTYSLFNDAGRWHAALSALVEERNALRERVANLKAKPADRDLRERLVCAALTGMLANNGFSHSPSELGEWAERYAYEAIAAMRKGET